MRKGEWITMGKRALMGAAICVGCLLVAGLLIGAMIAKEMVGAEKGNVIMVVVSVLAVVICSFINAKNAKNGKLTAAMLSVASFCLFLLMLRLMLFHGEPVELQVLWLYLGAGLLSGAVACLKRQKR